MPCITIERDICIRAENNGRGATVQVNLNTDPTFRAAYRQSQFMGGMISELHVIKQNYSFRLVSLSLLVHLSTRLQFNTVNLMINTCWISLVDINLGRTSLVPLCSSREGQEVIPFCPSCTLKHSGGDSIVLNRAILPRDPKPWGVPSQHPVGSVSHFGHCYFGSIFSIQINFS